MSAYRAHVPRPKREYFLEIAGARLPIDAAFDFAPPQLDAMAALGRALGKHLPGIKLADGYGD